MKTIPQHLETISCPLIRAAALRNYDPEYKSTTQACESVEGALISAFYWAQSPEEFRFWDEAHNALVGLNPLPEYPKHLIPEDKMKIDITKKYETRSGLKVVIHTDKGRNKKYPIIGEYMDRFGEWNSECWTNRGREFHVEKQGDLDLVEAPELKELWVNEYDSIARVGFPAEENARFYASTGAIRTAVRYVECPEGYEVVKIQTETEQ